MRARLAIGGLAGVAIAVGCVMPTSNAKQSGGVPAGERELLSYGLGYMIAEDMLVGLAADGVTPDLELVADGFADAVAGGDPRFDAEMMRELLRQKKAEIDAASAAKLYEEDADFRRLADENAAWSSRYIAEQTRMQGTRTLEGGVLIRSVRAGSGAMPTDGDVLVVNFDRFHMNGQRFDSGEGEAVRLATLPIGTQRAAKTMRVGGTYRVVVPPEQAFGLAGQPPAIGPNEAVTFEVTLVALNPTPSPEGDE